MPRKYEKASQTAFAESRKAGAAAMHSAEGLVRRIERKSADLTPELRARLRALSEG